MTLMLRLRNTVMPYAWGSHTAIAAMQGRASPTPEPEAELWLGAHPAAPSQLPDKNESLLAAVDKHPSEWLGPAVANRFGNRFPFLLKVLAAKEPLSLQAHPSLAQARSGFADEEARGVPRSAPHRNYKDDNHKPELICVLTPFTALYGFRDPALTKSLLESLRVPCLAPLVAQLASGEPGLRGAFEWLMGRNGAERTALVEATLHAAEESHFEDPALARSAKWAVTLGEKYPGDIGCISSLLLNCVELAPMQALYLPAGNLHAYLEGVGVEIMASSDNVLRGGLTPKHVDVPELLKVLDFRSLAPVALEAEREASGELTYRTPAPEFSLSRLPLGPVGARRGPEILLCTAGSVHVSCGRASVTLGSGQSAVLAASAPEYLVRGNGTLFRAQVGNP